MRNHGSSRQPATTIAADIVKGRYGQGGRLLEIYRDICSILSDRCDWAHLENYSSNDWELFNEISVREGAASLIVHKIAGQQAAGRFPEKIWNHLKMEKIRIWRTNIMRYKILTDKVIPAILPDKSPLTLIKGSGLALTLYQGDISLRSMCDFDLLIKDKETAAKIHIKLKPLGFVEVHDPNQKRDGRYYDKDLALVIRDKIRLMIEFHWNPLNHHLTYGSDLADWFKKQTMPLAGNDYIKNTQGVYTLTPTADFLLQVLHCYLEHGLNWVSLFHIYETFHMAFMWRESIDWDEVVRIFSRSGWLPVLKLASESIEDHFGAKLPVTEGLENVKGSAFINNSGIELKTQAASYMFQLKNLSFKKMIKVALESVFPSPAYMRERYGKDFMLFLYVRRWLGAVSDVWKVMVSNRSSGD